MADSDKNIIIRPNRGVAGSTAQPQIRFVGQNNDPITLRVLDMSGSSAGTLSFEGSAGQLFAISNALTSGSLFSVNDISGLPSIDVNANGTILFAGFTGNVGIGATAGISGSAYRLTVIGSEYVTRTLMVGAGISVTGSATVTGGSVFFGDIEVYDGAFIRTGGLSVTGGIAGTLVTPAQTNITSVGTLTSLTTSGLLSAQALNVVAGATFGADIYAPNMVTGVNGITGAVSLTSGSNITITQSGKQITIAGSAGGVTWSVVTADQTLTNNTGSFANKSSGTLALTLPTTAAVGTTISVSGMQNVWRIAQNASQKINFGRFSTTTGTGGYLESTNARDSVELVCCVANTEWNVVSSIGNMTIV